LLLFIFIFIGQETYEGRGHYNKVTTIPYIKNGASKREQNKNLPYKTVFWLGGKFFGILLYTISFYTLHRIKKEP